MSIEQLLLALAGFVFHMLKQWYENVKRNVVFNTKLTLIFSAMNLVAIPVLVYIGDSLPEEILVMSPLTCVMIGAFGSSMLAGIINTKKPKETNGDE